MIKHTITNWLPSHKNSKCFYVGVENENGTMMVGNYDPLELVPVDSSFFTDYETAETDAKHFSSLRPEMTFTVYASTTFDMTEDMQEEYIDEYGNDILEVVSF